jgi:peptidoglycan/xylan/chitin deacetylase (PgdA/CDA1 family)
LSHDVDAPFAQAFTGVSRLIRNCGGDILKRKSPLMALNRVKSWQAVKRGNYRQDLNYTFDRIMDISEQHNLQSAFYFKTACTDPIYDDNYSIDHPYIRQLMREIHQRGHEIGLHPSYLTYNDPAQTQREYERLRTVCEEEGIKQNQWGGRQHYLRWQVPATWRNWAEAGLDYDSTLSYADQAGFRCGVCYEFPVYDLEQRKTLPLIERPLVVMEGSVLGEQYMGLNGMAALQEMQKLKNCCRMFNGNFTLLWHNSSFQEPGMWEMYEEILRS